jgi:phage repressor protein C with HTH and peptisase S24 domain
MIDGEAFRAAREDARLSQLDLARMAGVCQQLIAAIETGRTRSTKFLPRIAVALNRRPGELDPDWLAVDEQRGPASPASFGDRDLPVYASAEGGEGQIIVSPDPMEIIPRPSPVVGVRDAYAVYITGESMVPEFEPGDLAIVNPNLPPIAGVTCIFYGEQAGAARATIKRLRRQTQDAWHVRQWNPPEGMKEDFTLPRSAWPICHRTVGKHSRR